MKTVWIIMFIIGLLCGYIISQLYLPAEKYLSEKKYDDVIIPIVAVNGENGTIGNATFSLIPGSGRVLLDNSPSIDTDIQNTMIIAIAYAKYHSNNTLNNTDLIIDFDMPNQVIGGVSAGAAITVGIIALLEEKKINNSIVLTGTISPEGNIRRVGEIREKVTAARNAGYSMFLVPLGQSRFFNQQYSLEEFLNNTITIKEVSTIDEALQIMVME